MLARLHPLAMAHLSNARAPGLQHSYKCYEICNKTILLISVRSFEVSASA